MGLAAPGEVFSTLGQAMSWARFFAGFLKNNDLWRAAIFRYARFFTRRGRSGRDFLPQRRERLTTFCHPITNEPVLNRARPLSPDYGRVGVEHFFARGLAQRSNARNIRPGQEQGGGNARIETRRSADKKGF